MNHEGLILRPRITKKRKKRIKHRHNKFNEVVFEPLVKLKYKTIKLLNTIIN